MVESVLGDAIDVICERWVRGRRYHDFSLETNFSIDFSLEANFSIQLKSPEVRKLTLTA